MDSLKNDDLAKIIGLYQPWVVHSVELSTDTESMHITIDRQTERSRFSFLPQVKKGQQTTRRWQHVRFGHFKTYIQTSMSLDDLSELTDNNCPAFLGQPNKLITRELADTIRIAYARSLSSPMISSLLGIAPEVVDAEIRDIDSEETQKSQIGLLPLESNPIWRDILTDKVKLSTRLLPLKLLLSRLKLEISRTPDDKTLVQKSIAELRNFFLRHATQLVSEFQQIGATQKKNNTQSAKTKLVLPSSNNKIWDEILTNRQEIPTSSMALQLNLAQQKRAYSAAATETDRLEVIRSLQLFFKHNARAHIKELRFLTELLEQQKLSTLSLPPVHHEIWKKLLSDDHLLESDKINYRLFLSRVKLTYLRKQDVDSIEQLRNFFNQNARAMTEEIEKINHLAKAI